MNQTVAVRLSDLLLPQNIELTLDATNKDDLITQLAAKAAQDLGIDRRVIATLLKSREALGSTGVGHGVAIPHSADVGALPSISHCEPEGLTRPYVALARLAQPIDFDAQDGEPVDIVLLTLTPRGQTSLALKILSAAARILRSSRFRDALRASSSGQEAYRALINEEVFSTPPPQKPEKAA